ncbi:MAG: ABC transporter permease [Pseudomonadota bacterium]|uniref:ABC transporter permease n=1 Tax=Caldimonas aquatica TaxID=376175 RepID=A0ABY6MSU1_9BURK|nr:ABC transporter permease [Schlegelella aquatica]UZD55090.1 ABC transporter permease [Schlegelella aquatica]
MSAAAGEPTVSREAAARPQGEGVWRLAWRRFRADRVGMASLAVVAAFLLLVAASAAGLVARDWQREVGVPYAPPSFLTSHAAQEPGGTGAPTASAGAAADEAGPASPRGEPIDLSDIDPLAPRYEEWRRRAAQLQTTEPPRRATLPLGGDRLGRDVLAKAVQGAQVSIFVGVAAAFVATAFGTALGALAGFFGGRLGDVLEWLYNVFTSVPGILLIFAFAAVFGRGIGTVVLILGFTGWTGVYRQVRAEYLQHAVRDYVRAAEASGAGPWVRMVRHILPNVSHVILVQLSILVVGFIKAEVILSYLGLGVPVDQVSWGTMLGEAQSELILGHWWQLATATAFMAVFVTAFSLLTDALRDALDPKLRGVEA